MFRARMRNSVRDGRLEALASIESFARELVNERARQSHRMWRLAW
jgi:hypothetical protein